MFHIYELSANYLNVTYFLQQDRNFIDTLCCNNVTVLFSNDFFLCVTPKCLCVNCYKITNAGIDERTRFYV